MAWTLCASGSAILGAGANANATITASGSALLIFSNEAEGMIEAECHTDFTSTTAIYNLLSAGIKNALAEICSAEISKKIVAYDPSGYSSVREAETILDVLDDRVQKGLSKLKEKQFQKLS